MDKTDRMERVNVLATQAKTDASVISELWQLVENLIRVICRRYCKPESGNRLFDFDDLCQSAYLGFLKTIDTYDPDRGAFSTMLMYNIRHSCREEIGLRGKRDALFDANSLDKSLALDGESDITLADTLADQSADEDFEDVNDRIYHAELHAALEDCMERLPEDNADLLRSRYYGGETLEALASVRGISRERARQKVEIALEKMRNRENMERLLPFWQKEIIAESMKYVGMNFFKSHWCSSTEWAAERIILKREREQMNYVLDKITSGCSSNVETTERGECEL